MRRMIGGLPEEQEELLGAGEGMGMWEKLTRMAGLETGGTMPEMSAISGMGGGGMGAGLSALGGGLQGGGGGMGAGAMGGGGMGSALGVLGAGLQKSAKAGSEPGDIPPPPKLRAPGEGLMQSGGGSRPIFKSKKPDDEIDISQVMALLRGRR